MKKKTKVYFMFDIGVDNGTDRPLYHIYPGKSEPQATFIEFDLSFDFYLFIADHCDDTEELLKPDWRDPIIQIAISPEVTRRELDSLTKDKVFFKLVTRLFKGFSPSTHSNDFYSEDAKQAFLEIESWLNTGKVTSPASCS